MGVTSTLHLVCDGDDCCNSDSFMSFAETWTRGKAEGAGWVIEGSACYCVACARKRQSAEVIKLPELSPERQQFLRELLAAEADWDPEFLITG